MIDLSRDVIALSKFRQKTSEFVSKLEVSGRPLLLTVNGSGRIVVMDVAVYQRLITTSKSVFPQSQEGADEPSGEEIRSDKE